MSTELIGSIVGVATGLAVLTLFATAREARTTADGARQRLLAASATDDKDQRDTALLAEYHAQGLAQSRQSFVVSLVFAGLGFVLIAVGVFVTLRQRDETTRATLTLVSGTVIEAVAALFFQQSNKARALMSEFFARLREDRQLRESLGLAREVADPRIKAALTSALALHLAGSKASLEDLERLADGVPPVPAASGRGKVAK